MIAIAVVGFLCGLAVFGRVRVVWVVVEIVYVGQDWVGYGCGMGWCTICMGAFVAAQGHQ